LIRLDFHGRWGWRDALIARLACGGEKHRRRASIGRGKARKKNVKSGF
jgi:hypothetical protein